MSDPASFSELMVKVRAGDANATNELLTRYGLAVRRAARLRMFNARLRRVFGSDDIAQSVLKSFVFRIADEGNEWKINDPSDLANLLIAMTQHKVVDKARYVGSKGRGGDHETKSLEPGTDLRDPRPSPDELVSIKEEAQRCWNELDEDARSLYKMRYERKMSWDEIGAWLGMEGDASRKKLERILADVAKRLKKKDALA